MRILFFLSFLLSPLFAQQSLEDMMRALEVSAQIDKKIQEGFPITFNHLFSSGYFVTPNARMTPAGSIGLGFAKAPPYLLWNARIQPFSHFELSANYKIFCGCEDAALGPDGFGDYADRGANFKFALFTPEDSLFQSPGFAFGIEDFMGSKKFTNYYLVFTQIHKAWGLEASFGWGTGQYSHGPSRGFFGAFNWFPFWSIDNKWIRGFAFTTEYDPTNYKKNPHPQSQTSRSPLNVGIKYSFQNFLEFSLSYLRGEVLAACGYLNYNLGECCGFVLKADDPIFYSSPPNIEPLGCSRTHSMMIQELSTSLAQQGFCLTKAWLKKEISDGKCLWLNIINLSYRQEHCVRLRLQTLLAALIPSNIDNIIVVVESLGLPCQQYIYSRELLMRYANRLIGDCEIEILTPRVNVTPPTANAEMIFRQPYELGCARLSPRFETFLGNAQGKFKYDLGLKFSLEGFLPANLFYEFQVSYTAFSTLNHLKDYDFFNPSQLLNVATDYINYRQVSAFTWDMLYLQKNFYFTKGVFGRLSGGYFQVSYAGVASEILWYPANSSMAIGVESAWVKKRRYSGLGFRSYLRQFKGKEPVYCSYGLLQQCFINFYLDFPSSCFFAKISAGQFLARDIGARFEVTRYFDNGVRFIAWLTCTNAADIIHGEAYFDKGVALEIPLDFFYKRSNRRLWNYGMAAWLRDAGYAIKAGRSLFEVINHERRW